MVCGRGGIRVSAALMEATSAMSLQEVGFVVTKTWLKLTCLGIVVLPPRRGDIISACARNTVRWGRSMKALLAMQIGARLYRFDGNELP
jgi:hypothetical protein